MIKKQDQNASFMVRFNQQIFEENGKDNVQWRGKITHVQDGDEQRFSDFKDALTFMQNKLAELTEQATKHESSEKQESILEKSLSMWKTIKDVGPKVIRDTIKDPKKQLSNLQEVQIDEWRNASRSDFNKIQNQIEKLSSSIDKLSKKVDKLNKS